MQILLSIIFGLMVMTSLFIGQALSGGHAPYLSFLAAPLFLFALFMPFLSEYNVLHRGFSKMGNNFRNLVRPQTHEQGNVEIILPGQRNAAPETYNLDDQANTYVGILVLAAIATLLVGFDVIDFYVLGDGLDKKSGPISNF